VALYGGSLREERLAQGDLLENYEFFRPAGGTYRDTVWAPAVVVSHSCDFTKFSRDEERGRPGLDRFPLLVAPVPRASQIPDPGTRGHATRGKVARYFHLPAGDPLTAEDHFIDFWFMQPAAVTELLGLRRLASMTDRGQRHLQRAIDRFFSWEDRKKGLGPAP
jgi:hypothetical protein